MGAPVGEAAAGIVDVRTPAAAAGAEIAVAATGVVRLPGGRPEPQIPVDVRRRGHSGEIAGHRRPADGNVDGLKRADLARPAGIDDVPVVFEHPLAAAGNNPAVAPGSRDHQRPFTEREGFGLLEINILAGPAGSNRHDRVPMVGGGDVDRIDVIPGQQFAEINVGGTVLVAVFAVHAPLAIVAPSAPHVAHRHILHVAAAEKRPLVAGAHVADADPPDHDPIAGRRGGGVAERLGGDHVGGGHGGPGGGGGSPEKSAPGRGAS